MQQINLYQASIRTPKQRLSLGQLAVAVCVLLFVLAGLSGGQWWSLQHSDMQLRDVLHQQTALNQEIDRLSRQLAQSNNDAALKKTIVRKQNELQNKQHLLHVLSGKHFGNTHGFADQFTGLARQHVQGIWLTGLYIHAGGEKLDLQGSTYAAELVPRYLQRLAQEPSFHGIQFRTFLMQRHNKSSQIDFILRSTAKAKEPG